MALPHYHVFNALQHAIIKKVKVEDVLPHLVEKKVISEADIKKYSNPKSGMRSLISMIRNRNYQTFLTFAECICLAQKEPFSKGRPTIMDSMIQAVLEYDQQNGTTYATAIADVQSKFIEQEVEEKQAEEAGTKVEQTLVEEKSPSSEEAPLVSGFTMPADLKYIEEPVVTSFNSHGGQFPEQNKYHGLSIIVPSRAVSEDQEVKLQIGVCCCGPFSISKQYEVASAFYVIVADGKFSSPSRVMMDHCLLLPEYRKCREVLILKSSRKENGLYTFDQFIYPDISPVSPELTFEIDEFCVLCAVLDEDEMVRTSSLESSASSSQANIDDSNPSSAQSSFDEEALHPLGVERSNSEGSQALYMRALSNSSESGLESSLGEQKENLRKRKADSLESEDSAPPAFSSRTVKSMAMVKKRPPRRQGQGRATTGKRRCAVEYTALLFQSKEKLIDVTNQKYEFVIFICTNCGAAQKMCMGHARDKLGSDVELATPIPITINSKVLKLEASTQKRGWDVLPERTAEISKSEVQFHTSLSRSELITRMDLKTYPPRLKFTAEFDDPGPIRSFSCRVEVKGATTTETQSDVFFYITASIPKDPTRQTGHLLYRQPAIDHSQMSQYPSQYYQPSPQGQFPPPYHSSQLPPHYQRQALNQPQENFRPGFEMQRSQLGDSRWYLPPDISGGPPQLSQTQYSETQEGYGLSQSSSMSHEFVRSQGSDISSHSMQRLSLHHDSSQGPPESIVRSDDIRILMMSHLCKYAHKWKEIGLALGFQDGELKNIVSSNPLTSTAQQLLTELLSQWCQWPTDAHRHDPTMERLCGALRSELVGLGAVANKLKDYCDH